MKEKDIQDLKPNFEVGLDRVGVTNLRTLIKTRWRGHAYRFIPTIELTMDLSGKRKGAHLSRLVESITEAIEEETLKTHKSLEGLCRHVLEKLKKKHPYRLAQMTLSTELVVEKKTPVSKKKTYETHDVTVQVRVADDAYAKQLSVSVVGNTVCPHAMQESNGKPHIQRALGTLTIDSPYDKKIALEDMIACVEKSFSSPAYTLLKTPDEVRVVEQMHANPKFAEDVCREILARAKEKFGGVKIKAKVTSQESIHRHDVIAEGRVE